MRRKKEEIMKEDIKLGDNIVLDDSSFNLEELIPIPKLVETRDTTSLSWEQKPNLNPSDGKGLINCLRNEIVKVRHINKQTGMVRDPRHVLYGGMAETAKRTFTVPLLRSGAFANVLTKDEKDYLEYILGLKPNALSVYNKENNMWSTANPDGMATVTLGKEDTPLDLSDPIDYIKYKILLANKDKIAPSLYELLSMPKATYEFVIVSEKEVNKSVTTRMQSRKKAYREFGKIEDNLPLLRLIIETIDGRPVSKTTPLENLQSKIDDIIQNNASLFLSIVEDPALPYKVLIREAFDCGVITKRGSYYYIDGNPLCEDNQEPTLAVAAAYLANPKRQTMKFSIEEKIKHYDKQ